jgi:hypothetical protein
VKGQQNIQPFSTPVIFGLSTARKNGTSLFLLFPNVHAKGEEAKLVSGYPGVYFAYFEVQSEVQKNRTGVYGAACAPRSPCNV